VEGIEMKGMGSGWSR